VGDESSASSDIDEEEVVMFTLRDIMSGESDKELPFEVNMTAADMADKWRSVTGNRELIQFFADHAIPPEFPLMEDLISRGRWMVHYEFMPAGY